MWALPADRALLLDIFSRQSSPPRHMTGFVDPKRDQIQLTDELLLLWASEPKPVPAPQSGEYLPDGIVVHPKHMREFLAWITTVAGGYRPFTAFVRVIQEQYLQHAIDPKEPSLGAFDNAVAGVVIAEALTLGGPQRSLSALSLLPCESTYCYSFARALALGYTKDGDDPLAAPFMLARRLTRQPTRKLNEDQLSIPLRVLSGLANGRDRSDRFPDIPPFIWETCRELQSEREITRSWRLLAEVGVLPQQPLTELRGPREQRVRAFERILKGPNRADIVTSAFVAGLLADQISPGSFEHVDLLMPYLNQYPTALIWYGLCAGLHPDAETQQVGNCLGRRLIRDLIASDPLLSRPRYDIAVGELEVHLDREEPLEFRTASQNHIAVELLPGVPAYMKWPVTQATETVSVPYKSAGSGARQVELPLNVPYTESGTSSLSADQHYAVQDLERAVERIKRLITQSAQKPSAPDKPDYKRRSKKT